MKKATYKKLNSYKPLIGAIHIISVTALGSAVMSDGNKYIELFLLCSSGVSAYLLNLLEKYTKAEKFTE